MKHELKVPTVGESIQEVQIGQWLKGEGQWADKDESLVEIESDKATVDLAAPAAGIVVKVLHRQGDVVPVGDVDRLPGRGRTAGRHGDGRAGSPGGSRCAAAPPVSRPAAACRPSPAPRRRRRGRQRQPGAAAQQPRRGEHLPVSDSVAVLPAAAVASPAAAPSLRLRRPTTARMRN